MKRDFEQEMNKTIPNDSGNQQKLFLVSDIGGTNARFGLVDAESNTLHHIATYSVKNYPIFEDAVDAYLQDHAISSIAGACLAVAGPVANNEVKMTNSSWHIKASTFCEHFNCEHFWLINDFVAQSMAVPCLEEQEIIALDDRKKDDNAPLLVLGPGTGLGAGLLVKTPVGWQPCPGEGGHMDFGPVSETDLMVWKYIKQEHGRLPCWEDVLSGYGLESLYAAHAAEAGTHEKLAASEVTAKALADQDSLAFTVVQYFLRQLARFSSNLAAITGAKGGVYIAGGIVPRVITLLDRDAFRSIFEQREKIPGYMESIPVSLVVAANPGLTGSAAYLHQQLALAERV
ncbi:glucokinase [Parendozoicomonas haliclonae]|uniref:Glucokinase n=1 Tax=Parendozoicomonas haliclonae TaxID=1960125 RepID=A0A1X7AIQ2_9GAMM|nr:glucokinase [Parendozoicomonas haliclonae]SMA44066.1 Glucokinase [Parendozoicomonas haliclonae]